MSVPLVSTAAEPWDGWERYPANLPSSIFSPFVYDLDFISEGLSQDSSRLFIAGERIYIRVIEVGVREFTIKSTQALENYLLETCSFDGIRILYGEYSIIFHRPSTLILYIISSMILQQTSWGALTITGEAAQKLFSSLTVFPEFLTILNAFGERTCLQSDGHGSFQTVSHTQPKSFECAYHLRRVEEHGREEESNNPWSIRQMGVYHKHDAKLGSHNFILINPPKHLKERLTSLLTNSEVNPSWQDIHLVLFSSASRNWPSYVSWIDEQFQEAKLNAHSATNNYAPDTKSLRNPDISISDAQNIELIRNNICDTKRYLSSNYTVISAINDIISQTYTPTTIRGNQHIITHLNLAKEQVQRLSAILEMLESTSTLIHNISEVRSLEALEQNAYIANEVSQRTEAGNQLTLRLMRKSYKDAHTLKMITIVTLLYLPASFIAQFLSAGYVTLRKEPTSGKLSLHVSEDIVIFVVLSVIFLGVTLGAWRVLERKHMMDVIGRTFYLENP
ncbi:uncharacterized protein TRUGW13939_01862 [Talaromyces rugulosus]|uniref:CorA-like transporter domain-containing protein n=1 Tax=Talaromyces rugulosus TaxID=121627 RepID=A0A7H8QNL6_TALRU|nr:uncharacterized protein TRUGW13939_01862 [Talaromyces rugulosus]QKX54773.1 hypothetical protein TRUGW13939_01862 [Talaromyces rugulosus]